MTGAPNKRGGSQTLASNRKASHEYQFLEKLEAGIALQGAEVKSIRDGKASLNEAFARIEDGQMLLYNMHVQPYPHARTDDQDPVRVRTLLLHRRELDRLTGQVAEKGRTLVPTRLYLHRGLIKVEIAVAKGKLAIDKRDSLKKKVQDRETARTIARLSRR
ncbi:MAG: SsrA-binding protein SmpB [Kiritimatiellae bacterium]|nr:SsrA-binding protein SmpB [Kiritimatiellia bacterium]